MWEELMFRLRRLCCVESVAAEMETSGSVELHRN